ncbi:MAG: hypothetical protein ACJA01_003037 [Saprospiraceae bacterium]|jgi:hypothetical protein
MRNDKSDASKGAMRIKKITSHIPVISPVIKCDRKEGLKGIGLM